MPAKKSSAKKSTTTGLGTIVVVIVVLLLGGYYAVSGADPLGLFNKSQTTAVTPIATSVDVIPTDIPEDAQPAPDTSGSDATEPPAPNTSFAPTSGGWWEVYFVNPLRLKTSEELTFNAKIPAKNYAGSIAEQLVKHIDEAKKTIHIASFEFDLTDVANALIRAKQRSVDVRWITDDDSGIAADSKPGRGQFKKLKAAGIPLKDDGRSPLMHDKFWLFDGQIVWTGSTNVTVSGMFEQNNNTIVIYSPELATMYENQFEQMWAGPQRQVALHCGQAIADH